MTDDQTFVKAISHILASLEAVTADEHAKELKEIYSIIAELHSLKSEESIDISDLKSEVFIDSLSPTQFDFFSSVINHNKACRLLLEAQGIYIKMLQKNIENLDLLDDIQKKAIEKEHELDLQIVTHEKLLEKEKADLSSRARFAANKKHEPKKNAKKQIVKIWLSGKYSSKDLCAEQECAALGLSFSTARKALRNQ